MKIIILLFASYFGFGLAINETVRVHEPAPVVILSNVASNPVVEQPVMDVMLDTVEITAEAPVAEALK